MKLIVIEGDNWKEYDPVVKDDEDGELKLMSGSIPDNIFEEWTGNGAKTIYGEVIPCCEIDEESTKTMFVMPTANDGCLPIFLCANCISKMGKRLK